MTELPNPAPAILFVDDEATAVKYFQRALGDLAPVVTASSVEEGKRLLDTHADSIRVLVSDQRMPGACGNELLFHARDRYPGVVRILTTAYSELEQTVDAVNQGQIHRYIQKPWEITALRMELKQALALAELQREHALLMREKMMVRQQQTVGNRIGTLYALCASLLEERHTLPVEPYLAAAAHATLSEQQPDWLLVDYCDLVAAEAQRSAAFGRAVRDRLSQMEEKQPGATPELVITLLSQVFGATLAPAEGGCVFLDRRQLTEYLETAAGVPVSEQHAAWLASLLWLARRGWSMELQPAGEELRARLVPGAPPLSTPQLAAWVDQF
ncbi:MAG TPA: response regulator [Telluria sp.]